MPEVFDKTKKRHTKLTEDIVRALKVDRANGFTY